MPTNYSTLFYDNCLMKDFVEFINDDDRTNEIDYNEYADKFVCEYYWVALNQYFMIPDNTNDISLLMYIKYEDNDRFDYITTYMNETDNICYVREKIYQNATYLRLISLEDAVKKML